MEKAVLATRNFRTDIEGLRGVCVIAVVLYHAFPVLVSGGFIGVDVFFVLSGYLITGLLLKELHDTGRVNLLNFWQRRIRRILPAATFVLCAVAALILLFPVLDARMLGRHIAAAALFYHNMRQAWASTDYLGADHKDNPLLHYWSLSVEEQFYLVWPLILAAMVWLLPAGPNGRWKSFAVLTAVLLGCSFFYSVHLTGSSPSWAFFGTPSRSWQLLAGALLAIIEPHMRIRHHGARQALGLASLAVLLGCFLLISDTYPYPGLTAGVPTLAAAMLIYCNLSSARLTAPVLGNAPLRFAGRISFSWYLWHWPLLVFGRLAFGDTMAALLSAIAVSFVLAIATYYFVEQPVRRPTGFASRPRFAYALGAGLIAGGAFTGLGLREFAPDSIHIGNDVFISRAQIKKDRPQIYADHCLVRFSGTKSPPCVYGARNARRTVVLLGDSHAANWFEPLRAAARKEGWRLLVRTKASCRPIDTNQVVREGGRKRPYVECARWLKTTFDEIASIKPALIVVAGTRHRLDVAAETQTIHALAAVGRTLVMHDTPWLRVNPLKCLQDAREPGACQWPMDELVARNAYPRTPNEALPYNAQVLNLNSLICPDGTCRAVIDGQVVMFDGHHLTAGFSRRFTSKFRDILSKTAATDGKGAR
ncbi:MAG: acyltransferase [Alphaproteobacteria bacterium]|nr:acyltransferase [Alphaproteobacteria bacterium]